MGQLLNAQDGKPYINAEVRATSQSESQTASTDTKGNYRFQGIPSGLYQVRASMGQKSRQTSARVQANLVTRLNFRF